MTCQQCFRGRHRACEDKLDCTCDVCSRKRAKVVVRKFVPGAHSPKPYVPTGNPVGRRSALHDPKVLAEAVRLRVEERRPWTYIASHLGVDRKVCKAKVERELGGKAPAYHLAALEPAQLAKAIDIRAQGGTWQQVSSVLGVDWRTCRKHIEPVLGKTHAQRGRPSANRKLTDEDVAVAVEMRRNGATFAEIGEHFGVSDQTASRALARATRSVDG